MEDVCWSNCGCCGRGESCIIPFVVLVCGSSVPFSTTVPVVGTDDDDVDADVVEDVVVVVVKPPLLVIFVGPEDEEEEITDGKRGSERFRGLKNFLSIRQIRLRIRIRITIYSYILTRTLSL